MCSSKVAHAAAVVPCFRVQGSITNRQAEVGTTCDKALV
jgi:hypothetical protein